MEGAREGWRLMARAKWFLEFWYAVKAICAKKWFWKCWRFEWKDDFRALLTPLFCLIWMNAHNDFATRSLCWGWRFYFWPRHWVIPEGDCIHLWRWENVYSVTKELMKNRPEVPLELWAKIAKHNLRNL